MEKQLFPPRCVWGGGAGRGAILVFKDTPTAFPHFNTLPSSSSNIQQSCKCAVFVQMDFLFLGTHYVCLFRQAVHCNSGTRATYTRLDKGAFKYLISDM